MAIGAEHRWEKFQNNAGEPDSYRDRGYVIPNDGALGAYGNFAQFGLSGGFHYARAWVTL